jgi:hypothetical protein
VRWLQNFDIGQISGDGSNQRVTARVWLVPNKDL